MRITLFNQHWQARGGGEKYAGSLAATLAATGHDVTVLGPPGVDLEPIGRLLGFSSAGLEYVPVRGSSDIMRRTSRADLFINSSFGSGLVPSAPRSVYVCHFPTVSRREEVLHRLGPVSSRSGTVVYGESDDGLWRALREYGGMSGSGDVCIRRFGQSSSPVPVTVRNESTGNPLVVTMRGARYELAPLESRTWRLAADSQLVLAASEGTSESRWAVRLRPKDIRMLGADLRRVLFPRALAALAQYDAMWTHSEFTRGWVQRRWHRDADVVYPPVTLIDPPQEGRNPYKIAVVGRFFAPGRGHSKRQLDLVRAFGTLVARDPGPWELVVIGSVSPENRPYLDQVLAAAERLPVRVLADAPRAQLEAELATSGLYWHGTGLGEDQNRHPERAEHFGITVVEAMSCGVIPIVPAGAGPQEIVPDSRLVYSDLDDLVRRTLAVVGLESLRAELIGRAQRFSDAAFQARVLHEVDRVLAQPGPDDDAR